MSMSPKSVERLPPLSHAVSHAPLQSVQQVHHRDLSTGSSFSNKGVSSTRFSTFKSIDKHNESMFGSGTAQDYIGHSEDHDDSSTSAQLLDRGARFRSSVVPYYKERLVMLKIGGLFLRNGVDNKPSISELDLPLYFLPELNQISIDDEREETLKTSRRRFYRSYKKSYPYEEFTFFADETTTIIERGHRMPVENMFNIRFSVIRWTPSPNLQYVCARRESKDQMVVQYSAQTPGSWWRLMAVGPNEYSAESLGMPGRYLMKGRFGLALSDPLADKRRHQLMLKGKWDKNKTLSVLPLPDFAYPKTQTVVVE